MWGIMLVALACPLQIYLYGGLWCRIACCLQCFPKQSVGKAVVRSVLCWRPHMVCPMFSSALKTSFRSASDIQTTSKSVQPMSRWPLSYCEMTFEVALGTPPKTQALISICNWLTIRPWHHHDNLSWWCMATLQPGPQIGRAWTRL